MAGSRSRLRQLLNALAVLVGWKTLAPKVARPESTETTRAALARFPFPRVEVPGARALAVWEELKTAERGAPIVLGDDNSVATLADAFAAESAPAADSAILELAGRLCHPEDLAAMRASEAAKARVALESRPDASLSKIFVKGADGRLRRLSRDEILEDARHERHAEAGEWPSAFSRVLGRVVAARWPDLTVAADVLSRKYLPSVHIALVPTDDWTTIPAHLRWGGWNECPAPEYHVAALRSWRDRYGVELVGLGPDILNLRVARCPPSRTEALALAREHYAYCPDTIDQGFGSLSTLAAGLMTDRWWTFWWD